MDINIIENKMYKLVIEKNDYNKINKLINALRDGKLNKDNYNEVVNKFTKNIHSDHSIRRWEILSECFYELIE